MSRSVPDRPSGTFGDQISTVRQTTPEPVSLTQATPFGFTLELFDGDKPVGWLGEFESYCWAVSQTAATAVQFVTINGVQYIQQDTESGNGQYLSVADAYYPPGGDGPLHRVGFYSWSSATGWTYDGTTLTSQYTNGPLAIDNTLTGQLYADAGSYLVKLKVTAI